MSQLKNNHDEINEEVEEIEEEEEEIQEQEQEFEEFKEEDTEKVLELKKLLSNANILYPCETKYNGTVNSSIYFNPIYTNKRKQEDIDVGNILKKNNNPKISANLRGRQLIGDEILLTENMIGLMASITKNGDVRIANRFEAINAWGHDASPSLSSLQDVIDFCEIANEVRILFSIIFLPSF